MNFASSACSKRDFVFTEIPPSNTATAALLQQLYAKSGREAEDEPKDGIRVEKKKAAAKQRQWIEN